MQKKKIYVCAVAGILVMATAAFGIASTSGSSEEAAYKETTVAYGTLTVGVTESGSVAIGTLEQAFDSSSSSSSSSSSQGMSMMGASSSSSSSATLIVEEVYASVGSNVTEGDAILKLTADSVADYRDSLEDAVEEAKATLSSAKLSAEKQKLNASYTYQMSVTKGSLAESTYNSTIAELQTAVDEAQEKVWASSDRLYYLGLKADNGEDVADDIEEEEENLEKLKAKLTTAQNNYTAKSIEAEQTYKSALLTSENAQSQYNVDVTGVDSSISDAEDSLDEAKDTLTEFNEMVSSEGYVYAEYTGMVTEMSYSAGDSFSTDSTIAIFTNPEEVTMTVSVSEEDITSIQAGDVVMIELMAYEDKTFEGEVLSMDTTTSSGSSTVSYSVTVGFMGDCEGIYNDMTGSVTFVQKQVKDVLYVSNKAIINEGTVSYVKVKDADGNISKVEVVTGFSDGVNVEITSGVQEGETVLIESQVKAQ